MCWDDLLIEPGAFYLLDRGYLVFARPFVIHEAKAFFVNRAKSNTPHRTNYSKGWPPMASPSRP